MCKSALLVISGDLLIVNLQMFFKYNNSKEAESFRKTWKAYEQILQKDCSKPCEQINPFEGTGINAVLDAKLDKYDLCYVCGIDGDDIPMTRCGCCQQNQQETVACLTCIPRQQAEWIQSDEEHHHWRCKRCRYLMLLQMLLQ